AVEAAIVSWMKGESAREDGLRSETREVHSQQRRHAERSQRPKDWDASREQSVPHPTGARLWTAGNRVPPDGSRHCGVHDGWQWQSAVNGQGCQLANIPAQNCSITPVIIHY